MLNRFKICSTDVITQARTGVLATPHRAVQTPAFMPVGTYGSVRMLSNQDIIGAEVQMMTSNAYHLYLKPGEDIIKTAGGLHKFINWDGAIFSDSGGFQIYSLASLRKVTDEGVSFQSHLDGSKHFLTPERVVDIGLVLGSDLLVPLDECVSYLAEHSDVSRALALTDKWARRAKTYFDAQTEALPPETKPLFFGIVQGGMYKDLRKESAARTMELGYDGYAIGGVSVGEPRDVLYDIAATTAELLPRERMRYLMGVGTPIDILESVSAGIDLFDCVIPTRNGRNGLAYTLNGPVYMRTDRDGNRPGPIEEGCPCEACTTYTRSYLRHLFKVGELLALRMVSVHNIYFYMRFMRAIRESIEAGSFEEFKRQMVECYTVEN